MMDVGIVGAGPAGSVLASILGEMATVFDPSHPREKPCGGGLTIKTWSEIEVPDKLVLSVIDRIRLRYLDREVEFNISEIKSVSRKDFDYLLLKEAKTSGAELIPEKVINVKRKEKKWIVFTDKDKYTFDFLVGADGATSIVRSKTIGPIREFAIAMEAWRKSRDEPELVFVPGLYGYAWVFPKGKMVSNVGVGGFLGGGERVQKIFQNMFPGLSPRAWLLPFSLSRAGFEDFALVGDAAGHVNPITGEGIYYAIKGAKLLGKAILEGRPGNYEIYWRRGYGKELLANRRVSRLVYKFIPRALKRPRFARNAFVGLLKGEPVTLVNLLKWACRDSNPGYPA